MKFSYVANKEVWVWADVDWLAINIWMCLAQSWPSRLAKARPRGYACLVIWLALADLHFLNTAHGCGGETCGLSRLPAAAALLSEAPPRPSRGLAQPICSPGRWQLRLHCGCACCRAATGTSGRDAPRPDSPTVAQATAGCSHVAACGGDTFIQVRVQASEAGRL